MFDKNQMLIHYFVDRVAQFYLKIWIYSNLAMKNLLNLCYNWCNPYVLQTKNIKTFMKKKNKKIFL